MSSIIKGIIKEEAQRLSQLETAYKQAQQITRAIKYEDGVMNIISEIQGLGQKYNIDPKSIKYAVSDVLEAKNALESAVYGLDELFKDAYQEEKWKHDDEQEGLGLREGEVVSMQARKTPLVVAGSPYDWDIYDLRTNKMVANILGGDRHDNPLYEIRIKSSGMTPTTRMLPTYVLRAGRNNNPPYKAYELVDTADRYGEIEKSPGPGGTTKLRPDKDDMLRHMFKVMGGGKYYGYDLDLVEEGLDQYEIIEKALGAKIMEIDDAMELGYTDWDPNDSSSIVYLGNKKNEGYSAGASGGAGLGEDAATQAEEKYHPWVEPVTQELMLMYPKNRRKIEADNFKAVNKAIVDFAGFGKPKTELTSQLARQIAAKAGSHLKFKHPLVSKIFKQLENTYVEQMKELNSQIIEDMINTEVYNFAEKNFNYDDTKLIKQLADIVWKKVQAGQMPKLANPRFQDSGPPGIDEEQAPMFTPEDRMVNANDPRSDGWRIYKAVPSGIMEGIIKEYDTKTIDSVVERLPKGLTVNNFTSPAFKEFLYQKYYSKVKADWDKLYPFFAQEYKQKHGIKEYKQDPHRIVSGDSDFFDNMLLVIPKGLGTSELYTQAFKEFLYNKFGDREWTDFKKNRFTYWDAYEKMGGSKPQGMFNKLKSKIGLEEDVYTNSLYKEFLDSDYNKNQGSYIESLRNLGQFIRSKGMPEDKAKPIIRRLVAKLHPSGINEDEMALAELKCWAGYTRVRGVPAGAPGSCKKKTKESSIMKGLNNETYLPHYTLGGKMYKSFTPADKLKNEPGSDTSDLENEANKEQLRRKMKEVLASLPERQRQVLLLRFYKNKTLDQTAEIMDVSPERVRQLEIKALHRIKTYFRGLDSFILDKARDSENWLNSFFRYNPLRTDEYKEIEGQRKIEFSKENPPDLYYLYQQFIQRMLNPENTIDPKDWIEKVNNHYGLNYTWKDYQKRGHNDHTDNWQKIINKYILKK